MLTADAPVAAQNFQFVLPAGVAPENGLQVKTIWAARAISVLFPQITTIGGYRQDALRWHPNGLAIDVMIPNFHSPEGIELGNQIAGYALANAKRWGVLHVIWRQKYYPGIGAPSWTADYGNETANHYDHVHISTDGGGYPTGHETYYIGSMTPRRQPDSLSGEGWSGHDGGAEPVSRPGVARAEARAAGQRHAAQQVSGSPGLR